MKIFIQTTILLMMIYPGNTERIAEKAETVRINEITFNNGLYYFEDHVFSGDIVDYYENDRLKFRYGVLQGRLQGLAVEYYAGGNVKSERHYVMSKLFGKFTEYYESGEVRAQFKVALNAYGSGELVEDVTIGILKNKKHKTKTYDKGIIYFTKNDGTYFTNSEEISLLYQTEYKIMDKSMNKVLIEVTN